MAAKSVAIVSKPGKPELKELLPPVVEWLQQHDYSVVVDHESVEYLPGARTLERSSIGESGADFALVLGGDGTLLATARAVAPAGIPILGVNLGALGFLTEVALGELYDALDAVDSGRCIVEHRSMLSCRLKRNGESIAHYTALNDVVVTKSAISRLVSLDLYLDSQFVSNYRADGIIVSTPTGSTAYSLAAGGPILMPSVEGLVISPVCPHSLTHRPLVIHDTLSIELVMKSAGEEAFLSIDGQEGGPLVDDDRLHCRKASHYTKLLRTRPAFFEVLQEKLKWGAR
ncbi:MAG: NAD(+)/NADH kinase [Candidatus Korobacteraceae bacterium]